jgi:hypothetical protein
MPPENTKITERVIRKAKQVARENIYVTSQSKLYRALSVALGSDANFSMDGLNAEIRRNKALKSELLKTFLNNQALGAVEGQTHLTDILKKNYGANIEGFIYDEEQYMIGERIKMEAASKLTETGHKAVINALNINELKTQNATLKREVEELRKQLLKAKEKEDDMGGVIHVYHQPENFEQLMQESQKNLKKRMEEPE